MRVLELFCGIGGCAAALPDTARVVAACDQNRFALEVYRAWHDHPIVTNNLNTIRGDKLPEAELWWMSPPCQPYTVRGKQRDLDDPRAASLKNVLSLLALRRPPLVGFENVPFFEGSQAHALLRQILAAAGYRVAERLLCPTQLGIPGERKRFYLVAATDRSPRFRPLPQVGRPLLDYLDPQPDPALFLEDDLLTRFGSALHVVDPTDPHDIAACFTSAYGRSPVYAGSYLRTPRGIRRFSPNELLRLLHFDPTQRFPDTLPLRKGWDLVGNSLSVAAVRSVLEALEIT